MCFAAGVRTGAIENQRNSEQVDRALSGDSHQYPQDLSRKALEGMYVSFKENERLRQYLFAQRV
jgi:hypothetical protein